MATRAVLAPSERNKIVFSQGSAPDPAGEAHDASPDSLVGWGGDTPPYTPSPRRLDPQTIPALFFFPLRGVHVGHGLCLMV